MLKLRLHGASVPIWVLIALYSNCYAISAQHSIAAPLHHDLSIPVFADQYCRETIRSLARRGISLHYNFVNDLSKSPFSANGNHDWFGRYSLDLSTDMDMDKAMGWKGASVHIDLKQHSKMFGEPYGVVAQNYSNIDADSRTTLYEAWVLESLIGGRLEIQAGKIDANSRFATVATAADFLNSSMGYSPTIMDFPTYPEPKGGIDAAVNLPDSFRVTVGGFRTNGGEIALAEAGKKWRTSSESASGKVGIGYWDLRQSFLTSEGEPVSGTHGYYGVLEQTVWQSHRNDEGIPRRNLTAFVQLGTGRANEDSFTTHLGAGTVFQSPFARRPADSIAAAATRLQAAPDPDPDGKPAASAEFVPEAFYKLALNRNVSLVTDAQYFSNPGAGRGHSPFFVLTPRLVIAF